MKPAQSQAKLRTRRHAKAKITVQRSEAQHYDQTADPALAEIHIIETFNRDINDESTVRALQVQGGETYATLLSMQRFSGKLGACQGRLVLQGQETIRNGKIKATWFVVPGSGTLIFQGCAAKVVLKATSAKDPTGGWITGSNEMPSDSFLASSGPKPARVCVVSDAEIPNLVAFRRVFLMWRSTGLTRTSDKP